MKQLTLIYSGSFPWTPVSGWLERPVTVDVPRYTKGGQRKKDKTALNSYYLSRALWCLLKVDLDGVSLRFADPEELDHVRDVFSKQVLQSTRIPRHHLPVGRPNNHWLSRLPKKAKSPKFRVAFERLVSRDSPEIRTFRSFYEEQGAA